MPSHLNARLTPLVPARSAPVSTQLVAAAIEDALRPRLQSPVPLAHSEVMDTIVRCMHNARLDLTHAGTVTDVVQQVVEHLYPDPQVGLAEFLVLGVLSPE
jgi:hypothetical protein